MERFSSTKIVKYSSEADEIADMEFFKSIPINAEYVCENFMSGKRYTVRIPIEMYGVLRREIYEGVKDLSDEVLSGKKQADTYIPIPFGMDECWWAKPYNLNAFAQWVLEMSQEKITQLNRRELICSLGYRIGISKYYNDEVENPVREIHIDFHSNTEYKLLNAKAHCAGCDLKTDTKNLFVCAGCNYSMFCGKDCQIKSYKIHKKFCRIIAKERAAAPPTYDAPPEYVAPPPEAPPPSYTKKQKKTKPPTYPRAAALSNPPR